jgi:hypothetical protein
VQAQSDRFDEAAAEIQRQQAGIAPKPEVTPDPAPSPKKDETDKTVRNDWQTKYNVLRGKYDAEVPRLAELLRDEKAESAKLRARVEELLAAKPAAPPAEVEPETDVDIQKLSDKFGEDMIAMVRSMSASAAAKVGKETEARLAPSLKKIDDVTHASEKTAEELSKAAYQRFLDDLTLAVPEWRTVDVSTAFHDYLKLIDPRTGRETQELLVEATKAHDVNRVAFFFKDFLGTPSKPEVIEDEDDGDDGRPSLESQAAPKPSAGGKDLPEQKKIWSKAEVAKFYSDVTKKRFTPEDTQRLSAEIDLAAQEGRIR